MFKNELFFRAHFAPKPQDGTINKGNLFPPQTFLIFFLTLFTPLASIFLHSSPDYESVARAYAFFLPSHLRS